MISRSKKVVASILSVIFLSSAVFACTPTQVETAKSVFSKVSFYSNLARALITVAEAYVDDAKVKTALDATRQSLQTMEKLLAAINAGINKDESEITTALAALVASTFDLIEAIKAAKAAKKTTTT